MGLMTTLHLLDGFVNIFLLLLFIVAIKIGLDHVSRKKAESLTNTGAKETMEKKIIELEESMLK